MRLVILMAALGAVGCGVFEPPKRPASQGPGCHYISCGDMLDGIDGHRCNVIVDNRIINNVATGEEAHEFIRRLNLRTCEAR